MAGTMEVAKEEPNEPVKRDVTLDLAPADSP